eukprot:TRINITY_DN408_c0_g1_i3.p1 TRINITY_DN408_c0_g1~~TRINITY_DN408_c0_g1_i3.p1  ORF type:complete len:2874 (-),score=654.52 TRINITY_DN408_c0_g1_i3:17-8638(-)
MNNLIDINSLTNERLTTTQCESLNKRASEEPSKVLPVLCEILNASNLGKIPREHIEPLFPTLAKLFRELTARISMNLDRDGSANVLYLVRSLLTLAINFGIPHNVASICEIVTNIFETTSPLHLRLSDLKCLPELQTELESPYSIIKKEKLLEESINYFGANKGFEVLFSHLRSPQCTLQILSQFLLTLSSLIKNNYLLPSFSTEVCRQLTSAVFEKFNNFTPDELRMGKEFGVVTNNILQRLSNIIERVDSPQLAKDTLSKLSLTLALQCFQSQIFNQKLYGLTFISDIVKSSRQIMITRPFIGPLNVGQDVNPEVQMLLNVKDPLSDESFLVQWIVNNNILETVLTCNKEELIRRSIPILEILADKDKLTETTLNLITNTLMTAHSSIVTELLQLVKMSSSAFQKHHVEYFLAFFRRIIFPDASSNSPSMLSGEILSFLSDMARSPLRFSSQKNEFAKLLWEVVVDPNQKPEMYNFAFNFLANLVTLNDFVYFRSSWIDTIFETMKNPISNAYCYNLLFQILSSLPSMVDRNPAMTVEKESTREMMASLLQSKFDVIKYFIDEYESFRSKVEKQVGSVPQKPPPQQHASPNDPPPLPIRYYNCDYEVVAGRIMYIDEIRSRLRFIELFLNLIKVVKVDDNHSLPIDELRQAGISEFEIMELSQQPKQKNIVPPTELFSKMWEISVVKAITRAERTEVLQWFINLRTTNTSSDKVTAIPEDLTQYIFERIVSTLDVNDWDIVTFNCFKRYFCDLNAHQKKMIWTQNPSRSYFGSFVVMDTSLTGYSSIWNVLLNSLNSQVVDDCIRFLHDIHHLVHTNQKDSDQLMSKCIQNTREACQNYMKLNEKSDHTDHSTRVEVINYRRHIDRCLSLLSFSLRNTKNSKGNNSRRVLQCVKLITFFVENSIILEDLEGTSICDFSRRDEETLQDSTHFENYFELKKSSEWISKEPIGQKRFEIHSNSITPLRHIQQKIYKILSESITHPTRKISENDLIFSVIEERNISQHDDDRPKVQIDVNLPLSSLNFSSKQPVRVSILPTIAGRENLLKPKFRGSYMDAPSNNKITTHETLPHDAEEKATNLLEITPFVEKRELALFILRQNNWDLDKVINILLTEPHRLGQWQADALKSGIDFSKPPPRPSQPAPPLKNTNPFEEEEQDFSNNTQFLESLFELLSVKDDGIRIKVWDLLLNTPLNEELDQCWEKCLSELENLLNQNVETEMFLCRLLYTIQSFNSWIFTSELQDPVTEEVDKKRATWFATFIEKRGLQRVVDLTVNLLNKINVNFNPTQTFIHARAYECLTLLLKIITLGVGPATATKTSYDNIVNNISTTATPIFVEQVRKSLNIPEACKIVESINFESLVNSTISNLLPFIINCVKYEPVPMPSPDSPSPKVTTPQQNWIASLLGHAFQLLYLVLHNYNRNEEGKKTLSTIFEENVDGLFGNIKSLLLSNPVSCVRDVVSSGFQRILGVAYKFDSKQLESILDKLIQSEPTDNQLFMNFKEYYNFLSEFVDFAYTKHREDSMFKKLAEYVPKLVTDLINRPVLEDDSVDDEDYADFILVGKMKVLNTILTHDPSAYQLVSKSSPSFMSEVLSNFLFGKTLVDIETKDSNDEVKCKSKASKKEVFRLIILLCKLDSNNYELLVTSLVSLHSDIDTVLSHLPAPWNNSMRSNKKKSHGFVGLKNLGATCYMNALLQQLYTISTLRKGILASPVPKEQPQKHEMLKQLQYLFSHLQESSQRYYDPKDFCVTYKDHNGNPINTSQQQDTDEFMNYMFNELENSLKGSEYSQIFKKHFGVVLTNEIRSVDKDYPYFSETTEHFYRIPLEVMNKHSIEESLNQFTASNALDGDNAYYCDKYDKKINASRRDCIKSLSNHLIFNLKRFDYVHAVDHRAKVNDFFAFPRILNIKRWTQEGLREQEQAATPSTPSSPSPSSSSTTTTQNLTQQLSLPDSYYDYELVGILVHSGSADSGHYYSYINCKLNNSSKDCWYEFNDATVRPFSPDFIPEECFGGFVDGRPKEKSAYMLFYRRVVPIDITYWGDDKSEDKNNTTTTTTTTSTTSTSTSTTTTTTVPSDITTIPNIENIEDKSSIHDVPKDLYNKVTKNNLDSKKISLFFDSSYSKFIQDLSEFLSPDYKYTEHKYRHSVISMQYVMNIVFRSFDKSTLHNWVHILSCLLRNNYRLARVFLMDQLEDSFTKRDPTKKYFFDNNRLKDFIFECLDERIRIYYIDLLTSALTFSNYEYDLGLWQTAPWRKTKPLTYYEIYEQKEFKREEGSVSKGVFRSLWTYLESYSRTQWRRFSQYFELFRNIMLIGHHTRLYFRDELSLIEAFQEYFKNNRNRDIIMDESFFPDLRAFYETIEVIVCSSENERESEYEKDKSISPTTYPGKLMSELPTFQKNTLFEENFFNFFMSMDYNALSVSRIMRHSAWNSKYRTKYFLNKTLSFEKLHSHGWYFYKLLMMKDSIQEYRIKLAINPEFDTNRGKAVLKNSQPNEVFQLLAYLAVNNELVRAELEKYPIEISQIKSSIKNRLSNTDSDMSSNVTDDDMMIAQGQILSNPPILRERRQDQPYLSLHSNTKNLDSKVLYIYFYGLSKDASNNLDGGSQFELKISELNKEIEELKSKNESLARQKIQAESNLLRVIEHYRLLAPNVPPPSDMSTSWTTTKPENDTRNSSFLSAQRGAGGNVSSAGNDAKSPTTNTTSSMNSTNNQTPPAAGTELLDMKNSTTKTTEPNQTATPDSSTTTSTNTTSSSNTNTTSSSNTTPPTVSNKPEDNQQKPDKDQSSDSRAIVSVDTSSNSPSGGSSTTQQYPPPSVAFEDDMSRNIETLRSFGFDFPDELLKKALKESRNDVNFAVGLLCDSEQWLVRNSVNME